MSTREFVRECRREVNRLGDGLVAAERGGDAATVDELFRTAHSLKGKLAMEGYDDASKLAHAVEDVLDAIRAGDLNPPPAAVIDRALDAVDELERAVEAIDGDKTEVDPGPTVQAVRESLAEHRDGSASAGDGVGHGSEGGTTRDRPDDSADPTGPGGVAGTAGSGVSAADAMDAEGDDELTAEEALAAVDEFDDLEGMAAEIDEADEFADLEGGGAFDDLDDSGPDPVTDDVDAAGTAEAGDTVATTGDDADTAPVGSEDGSVGGEPEFEELRESVEEAAIDELDQELESVDFGEFDDEDDMSIGDLVAADPLDEELDAEAEPGPVDVAVTETGDAGSTPETGGVADDAPATAGDAATADPDPAGGPDPAGHSDGAAGEPKLGAETDPAAADTDTTTPGEKPEAPAGGDPAAEPADDSDGFGSFEPAVAGDGTDNGEAGEPDEPAALGDIDESFGSAFDDPGDGASSPASDESGGASSPASDDGDGETEALERVLAAIEDDQDSGTQSPSTSVSESEPESSSASGSESKPDSTPADTAGGSVGASGDVDTAGGDRPGASGGEAAGEQNIMNDLVEPSLDDSDAEAEPAFERDSDTAAFEARFADAFSGGDDETVGRPATTLAASALDVDPPDRDDDGGEGALRIDAEDADELLSLAETVTASARQLSDAPQGADRADGSDTGGTVREVAAELETAATALRRLAVETRLTPIGSAFDGLQRAARDVAREAGRSVELTTDGGDVTVDRRVVDAIGEPLVHLVRNAVDHGIEPPDERREAGKPETGTVEVTARRENDRVIVEVRDDGRGVETTALRRRAVEAGLLPRAAAEELTRAEAFDLLFHPGLSTSDEVTSVSGRGVGMDVVKRTVDRLDGDVDVESTPGEGTTVRLSLPAAIAVTEALFVTVGDEEYALPATAIEAVGPAGASTGRAGGLPASTDGGESTRVDLRTALGVGPTTSDGSAGAGDADGVEIRVRRADGPATLRCDGVGDRREVVVDPYDDLLAAVPGVAGATVVGGDRLVNVLDIDSL